MILWSLDPGGSQINLNYLPFPIASPCKRVYLTFMARTALALARTALALSPRLRRHLRTVCYTRMTPVAHSIANGPEVDRPLLETSRAGYLAAVSTSMWSSAMLG